MPKVILVIESDALRGDGIYADPVRRVKQYYSLDGTLLAERDPWLEGEDKDVFAEPVGEVE